MSPRNAESAQPDLPHSDANQIPMPRFRRGPEQPDTAVRRGPASVPASTAPTQPALRKAGEVAPLPWPLPPVQELNKRRMLLQEERAKNAERHVEPVLVAPPVVASPAAKLAEPAASAIIETAPEPIQVSTPKPEPMRVESGLQFKLESSKKHATALLAEIRYRSLEAGSFARRLWTRRVRIRLATRDPLQKIVSGPMAVCRAAANAIRQNARLVNSLAMATLSALLAWGLIAAVRHYDPAAKAAGHDAARSFVKANPALAAPATAVVAKDPASKPDGLRTASSASKKPRVVQAADRKTIRKQEHRSGNDDYVAPDTYVYYGKR